MRDETAKDNRQTVALISHDLTGNNELAFFFYEKSSILLFWNTEIFLSVISALVEWIWMTFMEKWC